MIDPFDPEDFLRKARAETAARVARIVAHDRSGETVRWKRPVPPEPDVLTMPPGGVTPYDVYGKEQSRMNNADLSAMPSRGDGKQWDGLTKRELFAAMALQGLCADPSMRSIYAHAAGHAVGLADALLAELERAK
jgi:hypothetical protein